MQTLVLNSGSSSVKFRLFDWPSERELCRGTIDSIGSDSSASTLAVAGGAPSVQRTAAADHAEALGAACRLLAESGVLAAGEPGLVAHRVVHGGTEFSEATLLNAEVTERIRRLNPLAPLHNPANLLGVVEAQRRFPGARHVAVFDTAFHQSMPEAAKRYALPDRLAVEHGVRRYGFHGTSHRWASGRAAELLGRPAEELKTVVLHLGAGASACAIDGGRSIDTSMGMTPMAGLLMATRAGDLDPGVVLFLQRELGMTTEQVDHLLNHESGLVGLAGTADLREVLARVEEGDARARLAYTMYVERVAKQVGAYAVALGGLDALVFTAGVGENSPAIREAVVDRLSLFGARIDPSSNESTVPADRPIYSAESRVAVLVVAANEELQIAREAAHAIDRAAPDG